MKHGPDFFPEVLDRGSFPLWYAFRQRGFGRFGGVPVLPGGAEDLNGGGDDGEGGGD